MREARDRIDDPWAEEATLQAQARAAQLETAALIRDIAQSLANICIRYKHRGATPGDEQNPPRPCIRCASKVKHYREIADIISP